MKRPKRILAALLTAMLLFSMMPAMTAEAAEDTAWYTGTAATYNITTEAQLAGLATLVNNGTDFSGVTVTLGNNLDISVSSWTPIGNDSNPFCGAFDGGGHIISGLNIGSSSSPDNTYTYAGLFGYTGQGAKIENLEINNVSIYSSASYTCIGGVVGKANTGSAVTNCSITGTSEISGGTNAFIGGIGGISFGNIMSCYSGCAVSVSGGGDIGGIAGYSSSEAIINQCYAIGSVTGGVNTRAGGLIGEIYHSSIMNCYTTGAVTGYFAGGFAGYNSVGSIRNCYATGPVTASGGTTYVGGFAGQVLGGYTGCNIINCYAAGAAPNGFVGTSSYCTMTNCYWDTNKTASDGSYTAGSPASGYTTDQLQDAAIITGLNEQAVSFIDLFPRGVNVGKWVADGDLSNGGYPELVFVNSPDIVVSPGLSAGSTKIEGQVSPGCHFAYKTLYTVTSVPAAGDVISDAADYTSGDDIPGVNSGTYIMFYELDSSNQVAGYMLIKLTEDEVFFWPGSGTQESPYEISSESDLHNLAINVNSGITYTGIYFKVTDNISLSCAWVPIGNNYHDFEGIFDGQGHTVSGLAIGSPGTPDTSYSSGYYGLFGYIGTDASVMNLGVTDAAIYLNNVSYAGVLAGYSSGSISNCSAAGILSGAGDSYYLGGLVGDNEGTVAGCSSATEVSGDLYSYVGGLIGYNYGTVVNCSSTVAVSGGDSSYVGGLIGDNENIVANCYATGDATGGNDASAGGLAGYNYSLVTNCYYTGTVTAGTGSYTGAVAGDNENTLMNTYFNSGAFSNGAGYNDSAATDRSVGLDADVMKGTNTSPASITYYTSGTDTATVSDFVYALNGGIALLGAGDYSSWIRGGSGINGGYPVFGIPVTAVSLNKTSTTIAVGYSETLTATIVPANATNQEVTWSSSDTAVATVDSSGSVAGVKAGTATITATTTDGGYTAECALTVTATQSANAAINPAAVEFNLNNPADVSTAITWGSAQSVTGVVYGSDVLSGSDFIVNGDTLTICKEFLSGLNLSENDAMEFVISFDVGNSTTLTVRAVENYTPVTYPLTITAGTDGSITTGSSGNYAAGDVISIAAAASANYSFNKWTSTGGGSFTNANSAGTTFTMPANAATITATFTYSGSGDGGGGDHNSSPPPQPISSDSGTAAVAPAAGGTVSMGSEVTLQIPANALQGSNSAEVGIQQVDAMAAPAGFMLLGTVYQCTVNGQDHYSFNRPVTLTFTFDPSKLAPGQTPAVYFYDEASGQWVNIGGTVSGNTITVTVDHFTKYAVLANEATSLPEPKPDAALSDIAGHWAERNIARLVSLGAISGYPDGTFKPDSSITRAEFTAILVKAFKLQGKGEKVFADTTGHWAGDVIATAASSGIISGYDQNTFGPDNPVTREQMAVMTVKAAKLSPASGELAFSDNKKIAVWAYDSIVTAVKDGIIKGYQDSTFRPGGKATRAEAVTMIVNALK